MTIAVTGHRDIVIDERLINQIDAFFVKMLESYDTITLLSALADGADQLVAMRALKHKNISLEVPLPMPQEVYEKTLANKSNFLKLLHEATRSYVLPKVHTHPYENLGHYLVHNSDVLLALWDGTYNAEQGGTGDVVKYAKSQNTTIVHILSKRSNN